MRSVSCMVRRTASMSVLILFLILAISCPVLGDTSETSGNGNQIIIEDDAGLLTDSEEAALLEDMRPIAEYGNALFKSVSYNSFSTSYYASDYYHSKFGTKSGTLFLIDMDNREIYIFSDGDIYDVITRSKAYTITDNVYREASAGNYYNCASEAFRQELVLLGGGVIAEPMKHISNAILSVLIAMVIFFGLITTASRLRGVHGLKMISGNSGWRLTSTPPEPQFLRETRYYSPPSSSGGGSSGGGCGGGGGGGGSSGGGGGHGF